MLRLETRAKTRKPAKVVSRQKVTHEPLIRAARAQVRVSLSCPMPSHLQPRRQAVNQRQKKAKSRAARPTLWTCSSQRNFRTPRSAGAHSWHKSRQRTWQPKCSRKWTKELPAAVAFPRMTPMRATRAAMAATRLHRCQSAGIP